MSGTSLQHQMKTWEPPADPNHLGNRILSNDEDRTSKKSNVFCKLLRQQAAPELDIYYLMATL